MKKQLSMPYLQDVDLFRTLVEQSVDAMLVIDPEGIVRLANSAAVSMFGDKTRKLIGFNFGIPAIHEPVEIELPRGNETRVVEMRVTEIQWKDKTLNLANLRDVTNRKRAEKTLRENEELYRKVLAASVDGFVLMDLNGRIKDVNEAFCRRLGYNREELLGMGMKDILAEEDPEMIATHMIVIMKTGSDRFVTKDKAKDGRVMHIEVSAYYLPIEGGAIAGFSHDITQRKRAEESQLLLTTALESAANGVLITDHKGSIVWVNTAFTVMTGYTLQDVLGQNPRILKSGRQDDSLYNDLWKTISAGKVWHGELLNKKKDGSLYTDGMTITPLKNANSEITHFIAIKQDISERKRAEEALRESQEVIVGILDAMPIRVFWKDMNLVYLGCNVAFAADAGFVNPKEIIGKDDYQLGWRDQAERYQKDDRLVIESGSPRFLIEEPQTTPQGGTITLLTSKIPLRDSTGAVRGILGTYMDITERKRAEKELRLMAQTVSSARDCISITDLENRLLFVNDAFRNTYGYSTEELLGKDVSIVRSPNAPTETAGQILQGTRGGGWHGEIMNRRKDGSDFPVELWTSLVRDEAGTPVAMLGVARDITERKNADVNLRHSEQQFRLIAENVADMIAVLDPDGRRIYNSPSYRSLIGDPEALKGTDAFQEIHPDDVARVKQVFQETVRTGIGQSLEYQFLLKDGSVRNIESKGSVIRGSDGKISQVIVVSRDVTEEKKFAAQFLRAQRMESIGTLAGGIAHDLNNVLAPIMMSIEVLRTKMSDKGGQNILNSIETSARRGADIVRQVLAFGRGVKSDRVLVQLKHLMLEVAKIANETFPKSIEITTDIPRNLWTVSADPTQMHQVLLNMLVNARDAMPKGGTLTIAAENVTLDENYARMHAEAIPGRYVSMSISDTGTGIPADIREKIFEPFFTTKEIGMGTGLGLSTTLAIVKSHEGFINLYSEPGKGTTFRVYVPAIGTDPGGAAASEVVDLPMGHGELILVIDDEAAIRGITKETLVAYGYKAMTAGDGAEGVAIFAENKKDIKAVITDIMMPVMDGTAAILVLKRMRPDVKIIAASGLTTKGHITSPSDPNVQAFLTKPYTAEKLLKTLAEVLK